MAPSLGCEAGDERPVEQTTEHRDQDDKPESEPGHQRVLRVTGRAVVAVPCEQVGEAEDHVAKRDRTEARANTRQQRERGQPPRALKHRALKRAAPASGGRWTDTAICRRPRIEPIGALAR
jgi:hypothetical protein